MVRQASWLPFVTPDSDPSGLCARVRGHNDRQSRPGVTVLPQTQRHLRGGVTDLGFVRPVLNLAFDRELVPLA